MKHALLFVLASLMITQLGCSVTKTNRVITGRPGAAHSGEVLVVMHGSPTPPHEEIAIVQAVGQAGHADLEHVVAGLKKEAQGLGCTGLINVKVDQGSGSASGTAVCVRILDRAPQPAPPAMVSAPQPTATPASAEDASASAPEPPSADADAGSM